MKPLSPQEQAVRDATVGELRAIKDRGGQIPNAVVKAAAAKCGVDPRTIRRWIAGDNKPRARFAFTDRHLSLIAACGGNIKLAFKSAGDDLRGDVDYRTWIRAWNALDPYVRTELTKGPQAAKRFQFYTERVEGFVGSRFELDGWSPNIKVRPRGRPKTSKYPYCFPTVLLIIDATSRYIMSVSVRYPSGKRGNATEALATATMVSAMRPRRITPEMVDAVGDFEGIPNEAFVIGGVPRELVTDNEGALGGAAMHRLAEAAGFNIDRVPAYTGEAKPKVERVFGTHERGPLYFLNGQTKGPRTYDAKQPFADRYATQYEFEALLHAAIDEYNHRSVHSALGTTPYEAYLRRPLPLEQPDAGVLRPFLMPHPYKNGERILERRGVLVDGTYYILDREKIPTAKVGENVRVLIEPGEDLWIDVWRRHDDGTETYLGRADHPDTKSIEDLGFYSRYRTAQRARIRPLIKEACEIRAEHVRAIVGDDALTGDLAKEALDLIVDLVDLGKLGDDEVQEAFELLRRALKAQGEDPDDDATDAFFDNESDDLVVVDTVDDEPDIVPVKATEQARATKKPSPKSRTRSRKSTGRKTRVHKSPRLADLDADELIRQAASDR